MMKKEIIQIPGIPRPSSPYNHVVKAGNMLYLTSQLSCDLAANQLLGGTIEEQTRQALENVRFLLEHAGSSMEQVVDVTVFMQNLDDFPRMDTVYRQFFAPGKEPARVTVQAASPVPGIKIEIKVTALCGD